MASVTLVFDVRDMAARIPVYLKLDPDRVRLAGEPTGRSQLPALRQLIDAGLRAKLTSQSFVIGEILWNLTSIEHADPFCRRGQAGHAGDSGSPFRFRGVSRSDHACADS